MAGKKIPSNERFRNAVATWLRDEEYDKLVAVADANNIAISAYLRAGIIDMIDEDYTRLKSILPGANS